MADDTIGRLFGTSASPALTLEIGGDRAKVAMSRFAVGLKDWTPFWRGYLAPQFFGDIQANFAAEGGLSQEGGWSPLTPAYAQRKARTHPGRGLMVRDGTLKTSLTWRGALYSTEGGSIGYKGVARFTDTGAELGTTVPYATVHQEGNPRRNLPRRRLLFLPAGSAVAYGKLMHRWAYEQAKKNQAVD